MYRYKFSLKKNFALVCRCLLIHLWVEEKWPCTSHYDWKTNDPQTLWCKTTIYYDHIFGGLGTGIWCSCDSLSLLHDVWDLSWQTWRLGARIICGLIHSHIWWLILVSPHRLLSILSLPGGQISQVSVSREKKR